MPPIQRQDDKIMDARNRRNRDVCESRMTACRESLVGQCAGQSSRHDIKRQDTLGAALDQGFEPSGEKHGARIAVLSPQLADALLDLRDGDRRDVEPMAIPAEPGG